MTMLSLAATVAACHAQNSDLLFGRERDANLDSMLTLLGVCIHFGQGAVQD